MRQIAKFVVYGDPVGKQRPKATSFGGHARVYTPSKTLSYEALVKQSYLDSCEDIVDPSISPVEVRISIYSRLSKADFNSKGLPNKKGESKLRDETKNTKKPDIDNVCKSIIDGGLNGLVIQDDSQVVSLVASKRFDVIPRVEVEVYEV